jgi:hypothetical protein
MRDLFVQHTPRVAGGMVDYAIFPSQIRRRMGS